MVRQQREAASKPTPYLGDATTYCFLMDGTVTTESRAFVWLSYLTLFFDFRQHLHGNTTAVLYIQTRHGCNPKNS
jgi:hypothetical protein